MSRKISITVIAITIILAAALLVAYPQSLKNSWFARGVDNNLGSANGKEVWNRDSSLVRQPEALKLSRVIGGKRFKSRKGNALVMQGLLKTNRDSQQVTIIRRPAEDGEQVEVTFGGTSLAWSRGSGPQSLSGEKISETERVLLERFTCDSVDQFLLAQLRGAGYSVVIRNLRPDDASDDYSGPIWDVIRVDDPESDDEKRSLSAWRLYYINRTTGLIDKVVSEVFGERVEAHFSDWTERHDEKFPASITWTRGGQPLMTLNVIDVSFASN